MRLYLAGTDSGGKHELLAGLKHVSVLVSYWYILHGKGWQVVEWANQNSVPVFLDSGAFSAMNSGAKIDLNEYIRFCQQHRNCFEIIASLDVIKDHEATWRNHCAMSEAGVASIPAFHIQEPFMALERMVASNEYVALGVAGMQVSWAHKAKLRAWLAKCFVVARHINPLVKIHGFGITSSDLMWQFPWESVDSTTWLNAGFHKEAIVMEGRQLCRVSKDKRSRLAAHPKIWKLLSDGGNEQLARHNAETLLGWVARYKRSDQ